MKFDSKSILAITVATLLAVSFEFVHAGCPNACSGNGVCVAGDMCQCNRNWAGADCSQRVCPFGYAHVTTPLADWNSDGDRRDNTEQLLSATCAQNLLSTSVTLGAALKPGELGAGDGLRIGGQDFIVISISGTAVVVDKVRATTSPNGVAEAGNYAAGVCFKLVKSQANPAGTWESWPGDFPGHMDAATDATKLAKCPNTETVNNQFVVQSTAPNTDCADEGHYYMECSNRGVCDRKAGTCKCFPGYDGTSCQRTVCPNDCSGHGTCEKVSELRSLAPKQLSCYVSGTRGVAELNFFSYDTAVTAAFGTAATTCGLANGDSVLVGDHPTPLVVNNVKTGGGANDLIAVMAAALPKDFQFGTTVRLIPKYDLWDADKNRACKCDSGYSGFDCSERKCPYGDDPLTTAQQFETQFIDVGGLNPLNAISGSFKLTFEDMFGEKWTTSAITVDGTDRKADVLAALQALPNEVVQDATVTYISINSGKGARYMVKFDGGTTGTATGNSGDLPTMGCDASGLGVKLTTSLGAGTWASNVFTLTTALSDYTLVMVGDLVTVDGSAYATVTSWTDNSGISTITTSAALTGTPLLRLRIITDSVECTVSDTAPLIASTWATTAMTADIVDASGGVVKHILLKSAGTASHADTANLAVGDQIHVVVDQATQQTLTVSRIGGAAGSTAGMVEIAETINLAAATGASVYRYGKGSKEKSVCSGRGLCDIGSGTCKCFKGYTMDDCSRQNTLAL